MNELEKKTNTIILKNGKEVQVGQELANTIHQVIIEEKQLEKINLFEKNDEGDIIFMINLSQVSSILPITDHK